MTNIELYSDICNLPDSLKKEVKDFVESLKIKYRTKPDFKKREFGCSKGLFKMHDDFDEPLNDFSEYM